MTIGTDALGVTVRVDARLDAQADGEVSIEYDTWAGRDHEEVTRKDLAIMLAVLSALDGISAQEQSALLERAREVPSVVEDIHRWVGAALAREAGAAGCLEIKNRLGVLGGARGACLDRGEPMH